MYADGPGAIAESSVMSCAVCAHGAGATVEYRMSSAGASVFVGVRSFCCVRRFVFYFYFIYTTGWLHPNGKSVQKLDIYVAFVTPILCPDILYLRRSIL
jgi:hypothetical protein